MEDIKAMLEQLEDSKISQLFNECRDGVISEKI